MGYMNRSSVNSKIFNEKILWHRNWRYSSKQKDRTLPLQGVYELRLVDKLMNKKTEIKSNIVTKEISMFLYKNYLLRDTLDRVVRNCSLRRWHLFDFKDQKSELHKKLKKRTDWKSCKCCLYMTINQLDIFHVEKERNSYQTWPQCIV